jgi:hypothetical protein
MACAFLLPPPLAGVVAGGGMLIDELRFRSGPDRLIFNVASTTFTVGLTALVAGRLDETGRGLGDGNGLELLGFLLVAATYYTANTLLVAGASAIASQESLGVVLMANVRFTAPAEFVVAVLSASRLVRQHERVPGDR